MSGVREFLASLVSEPRASDPPRRVWRDWVLVALLVPACLIEGLFRVDFVWRVPSTIVGMALVGTLLWRRTHPLAMVALAFGAIAVLDLARLLATGRPWDMYATAYVLVLSYALARWASGREIVVGLAIMLVPATISMVFDYTGLADAIGGSAVFLGVLAIGAALRYRSRERSRWIEQVQLLERERLARDLHDTVAHHVSAIAIRAQAGLAVASARPEAAAEALRVIEAEASRALGEMRAMVRFLRSDEPAALAPNPQVIDLRQLAGRTAEGPVVDVDLAGDVDLLPAAVSSALYRLAQESITNARRHARHATRIEVGVRADATWVRLCVRDDGATSGRQPSTQGYGLRGMTERAQLLGGTCTAGPDPERGWTVTAVLPRMGAGS
jgi:signal transduction histidine kinase